MDAPPSNPAPGSGRPLPPPPPPGGGGGGGGARSLRRRPDEGHIGGVCAGLAEYFSVDPVIVRIAAVVLALSGPGVIAYVLLWIFVPKAGPDDAAGPPPSQAGGSDRGMQIFGIVLLVIALSALWGDWWAPGRRLLFPFALIALGAWLLLRRTEERHEPAAPAGPAASSADPHGPPGAPAPAGPAPTWPSSPTSTPWVATPSATAPAWGEERTATGDVDGPDEEDPTLTSGPVDEDPTVPLEQPPVDTTLVGAGHGGGGAGDPTEPHPWAGPPPSGPGGSNGRRRRGRILLPLVLGALLVWAGIAWLVGVSLVASLAVALCIVGVGFVLGAFIGGSWLLAVPAAIISAALVAATVVDIPFSGPIGDRTWSPREVAQVEDRYEMSVGEGVVDLTRLELERGEELEVAGSVGIGHLVFELPPGVAVEIDAEVGIGELVLLGVRNSGFGVSDTFTGDSDAATGTIKLALEGGIGQIEVRQVGELQATGG